MGKIVTIYFYWILKVRKKTNIYLHNNWGYIAQWYTLLYILIMRLRLKNVYLFAWYLFRVKSSKKMCIAGIGGGGFCLRFRRNFLGIPIFKILRFRKIFFRIWILRFHRKMCRLFPCIRIFKRFFLLIKTGEKCVYVIMLKITLWKMIFFWCEKGFKWIIALGSPKTYFFYINTKLDRSSFFTVFCRRDVLKIHRKAPMKEHFKRGFVDRALKSKAVEILLSVGEY